MDNLTHTLTGFALSRSGIASGTKGSTLALILASNIPDIDLVTAFEGETSYLAHHRGISHSVLGAPILAIALALILRLAIRGSRLALLVFACLVGVFVHVFMDVWTSYGTRFLEPFSHSWYALDLVFIVDPLILAVLLLPFLSRKGPSLARVSLGLLVAYVGARAVLHAQALRVWSSALADEPVVRSVALPDPVNPFRWRALADSGGAYEVGDVTLTDGLASFETREKEPENGAVAAARRAKDAEIFLNFSTFPWLEVKDLPEGWAVTWTDLRFERAGQKRFKTQVVVSRDGRILSQGFRF